MENHYALVRATIWGREEESRIQEAISTAQDMVAARLTGVVGQIALAMVNNWRLI